MGPLHFMVIAFDYNHFHTEIIPELRSLTNRDVIRIVDMVVVNRLLDGSIVEQEVAEIMPEEDDGFLSNCVDTASEWFTQEDVQVAGQSMTKGTSIALLLLDHRWAEKLDNAVNSINQTILNVENQSRDRSAEIERQLVMGANPTPV